MPEQTRSLKSSLDLISMLSGIQHPISNDMILTTTTPLVKEFTVVSSYEKSNGKFNAAYGNVLLMDCHYVLDDALDMAELVIKAKYGQYSPKGIIGLATIEYMRDYLTDSGETMCDFAYSIEGVLNEQAYYYQDSYDEIQ